MSPRISVRCGLIKVDGLVRGHYKRMELVGYEFLFDGWRHYQQQHSDIKGAVYRILQRQREQA